MASLVRALLLVCASFSLAPAPAGAQADSGGTEDAEARANFDAGRVAFSDARYADALGYFERAHVLSQRPELLYNVALCHDRLGQDAEALAAFEAYLAGVPDAPNRAEVEQRIATARERVRRGAVAVAPAPAPAPTSSADPTGWILLGVGVAVAAGGAAMLGVGRSDVGAVEASMGTLSWTQANEVVSRGDALTVAGALSLGVGVALAATGVVLALSPSSDRRSSEAAVRVRVGPGSIGVGGTF